ncbi:MAG: hypothetical protein J6B12_01990 [Clostridia bacterium]|nr:hypothetical protein [Clostridia bacterium]
MLYENRPNIVVDDNYRMFVKEMQRRYAERGAFVYTDDEAIEQERKDAHARAMAPDAYRMFSSMGKPAKAYTSGEQYMTTEDYLQYFEKCHDTFDAVNYYTLHKEQPEKDAEETKVLVNRTVLARVRAESERQVERAPRESFFDRVSEFLSAMNQGRRRAMTGMAAAALSLVFVIGGMSVFATSEDGMEYASRDAEARVMDVAEVEENENLIQG